MRYLTILSILVLGLSACSGSRDGTYVSSGGTSGGYKVGNPYKIAGRTYTPHEDPTYDKTGMASWYGPNFHGKLTANGEIYNQRDITAAHKTLPLPSMVRVTNLENGRTLIVRVNDRGPYSKGRIIDLSERGAELLDFKKQGTAQVRVQFLPGHTQQMLSERAKKTGNKSLADAAQRLSRYSTASLKDEGQIVVETLAATEDRPYYPNAAFLKDGQSKSYSAKLKEESFEGSEYKDTVSQGAASTLPGIYVQTGAFSVRDNASKMAHKLLSFGETVVSSKQAGADTIYRVRLGPLASRDQAEELLAQVKASGYSTALIIQE